LRSNAGPRRRSGRRPQASPSVEPRVTRRSLFLGGGLAGGRVAAAAMADPGTVFIEGVVDRASPTALAVRVGDRDDLVTLRTTTTTTVERHGPAGVADFVAGDCVAAEGRWRDDCFVATALALLELVSYDPGASGEAP
jgi:hypothetical protein